MFSFEFSTFYAPASAKHLQTNRRNPSFAQRQIFAYIYLSRPGADNCRNQLRSAPGLLRYPSGVLAFDSSASFPALFLFLLFFFLLFVFLQFTFLTEGKTGKKTTPNISNRSGTNLSQHFFQINCWMVFVNGVWFHFGLFF